MKKRIYISSAFAVLFFVFIIARLGYIVFSGAYAVSDSYNSYSIVIDTIEPNLYYSNNRKLTNNVTEKYALIKPNSKALAELQNSFDNADEIRKELKYGKPVLIKSESNDFKYIKLFNVTSTSNNCRQLVSKECSGVLKYLPDTLGRKKFKFHVDALGRMLTGDEGEIVNENYVTSEGLQLTLNEDIQNITYDACKNINSGCAIVMEVRTSSILACVTKPDSSFLNKPFRLYPVGSVFKILMAACALENGINPTYKCEGKITIGDTVYNCQKHAHGVQNLEGALACSCNCYFVNLAMLLGEERIINTAKDFGFDANINIYDKWKIKSSLLPSVNDLKNYGELPLLGFGQGKLMSTPLQICNMLCTAANGGYRNTVKLVTAKVDKFGNRNFVAYEKERKVISNRNSYLLLKYMRSVVEDGTGKSADYNNKSAGKTATAQTGQFKAGREVLNTWFAGVYPYDEPEYAIVVMVENGNSGAEDCCPVFSTIVENLEHL